MKQTAFVVLFLFLFSFSGSYAQTKISEGDSITYFSCGIGGITYSSARTTAAIVVALWDSRNNWSAEIQKYDYLPARYSGGMYERFYYPKLKVKNVHKKKKEVAEVISISSDHKSLKFFTDSRKGFRKFRREIKKMDFEAGNKLPESERYDEGFISMC